MIDLAKTLTLLLVLGLSCQGWAFAQDPADSPFGESDNSAATSDPFAAGSADNSMDAGAVDTDIATPTADAAAAPGEQENDPLIQLLRSNPPKSPAEYAERLEWMTRVRRWDEIGRYLDLIKSGRWSTEQLAELSMAGGPALWFKLRDATTELSEAHRQFVREVAGIPARLARDPRWIDSWIERLENDNEAQRKLAHVRLVRAGRAAVERLTLHLLSDKSRVRGAYLVEALLKFDDDGLEALRAACGSSNEAARGRVLLAIAKSPATQFGAELGTAIYSETVSLETRQAISDALSKKHARLPEAEAVRKFVHSRFQRQLDEYQLARSRPARIPMWVWRASADGLSVRSVEAPVPDHALEGLAQLARLRAALVGATNSDWVQCATVLAQHAYQANVALPLKALSAGETAAEDSVFWKHVLQQSQDWQMHGASVLAAERLGRDLDRAVAGDPVFDFLASCLRDSRPVMRYIALSALAQVNMQTAYNGSATALEVAIEMTRLGRGPQVLVVGLSSDLRAVAQQQLTELGASAIAVSSTAEALQVLDQPNPIEMIMVVDRLPRNSILTCVERLRHSRRGGSLPIAVLTEDMDTLERNELGRIPGVVLSLLSEAPDQMRRTVFEMERRLDIRPLTEEQRIAFAASANQMLSTIASDRKVYSFYPLARWEQELASLSSDLPTETHVALLGGLGTAASQQQLIALASDNGLEKNTRTLAAEAFERSVSAHGLLLNGQLIKAAYETYNTQGPTDEVTVTAVGKVLDAIETKIGKGS